MARSELGPYAAAIVAMRETLTSRAAQYKWLVIVVVVVFASFLISAFVWHDWRSLMVLLLLPSVILVFCAIDAIAVQYWRAEILRAWSAERLQLDILVRTLCQVPEVPAHTRDGMLFSLPGSWAVEVRAPIRSILSEVQVALARATYERLFGWALVWTATVGVLYVMTLWRDPLVSFELLAGPSLVVLFEVWNRRRMRRAVALIKQACRSACVDWGSIVELLSGLDWRGVPARFRALLLASPPGRSPRR